MSKNLNLNTVNKEHNKEFSEVKRVPLSNGSHVDIQLKFKPTSVQRLLLDYQDVLEQMNKKKANWNIAKDVIFAYYMLLLKHFTSANNIPSDIEDMIIVCEKLTDMGVLEEILVELPQDELGKVKAMIEKVSENSNFIGNQVGELFVQATLNEQETSEQADA